MLDLLSSPVTDAMRSRLMRSLASDRYGYGPVYVISDSAYQEALETERLQKLGNLRAAAAAMRERLAVLEAQISELSPGDPKT